MEIKEHEAILNGILESVTDGEARSKIVEHLEALREDYGAITEDLTTANSTLDKLKKDNEALVISNSKLFRERANVEQPENNEPETDQNITLDDLGI
ncbi:TPA: gp7 family phage scaffolding protein [Enterococcus faecium]|nr:hypothetical protein [Enterococcus faecium]HAZ9223957.1 hypothetical protein [Enterococcus faecium]HAZ9270259.1 hypothetical protein [Enterococcus faecium]HAZ9344152.1 hypothetical protein [Enterococcus faecium]HAZ9350158.1 hypothetical protein [Enterococcus faecium]